MDVPSFSLSPALAEAIDRSSREGQPLMELIRPRRPFVTDWDDVPDDAEYLETTATGTGVERLAELENLIAVWGSPPSLSFFLACAKAPRLRALYTEWFDKLAEVPLAGATSLEHLMLAYATQLVDLSFLRELPALRTLFIHDMKRLDLATLPEMPQLFGLSLGGGVWSTMKIQSFAPLEHLPNLRYLKIFSLRSADDSLKSLAGLRHLEELSLPNSWPMDEFARLSGALPDTRSNVATPFFTSTNGGVAVRITTPCKTCGGGRIMMTGRPAVSLCPDCHKSRLDKRIAQWEIARASGWPRTQ